MKCTLADVADITMGQSPKSEYYNSKGDGIPFLQGNRTFGRRYPIFDTYTTFTTKIAKAGDVIMSVRAPVGDLNIAPVDMCLGRGVCGIKMKNGNNDFLFYLLKYYMPQLINKETGTVFGSVNKNDINGLEIDIPKEETVQKKIARYLSLIDDKIEENEKINKNLEQQAFALFDSSFPDIINGENIIGELITPKRGKSLLSKDAILGNIPVVAGGLEPSTYHNVSNTQAPVVTISASGANAGFVNLWNIPVWSSDSSFIDNSITPYVFFWYVMLKKRQKEIFDAQTGSAQPHIYPKHIAEMSISDVSEKRIYSFETQVSPFFNFIGKNKNESVRLSEIRDFLLPKLISGEIDVSSIDL